MELAEEDKYADAQLVERTWAVCDLKSKRPCSVYFFSNFFLFWTGTFSLRVLNVPLAFRTRLKASFERQCLKRLIDHADR